MTQTVLQLIKLLTDKGLPITTATGIYLPTKKTPTEAATSGEGYTNIN